MLLPTSIVLSLLLTLSSLAVADRNTIAVDTYTFSDCRQEFHHPEDSMTWYSQHEYGQDPDDACYNVSNGELKRPSGFAFLSIHYQLTFAATCSRLRLLLRSLRILHCMGLHWVWMSREGTGVVRS